MACSKLGGCAGECARSLLLRDRERVKDCLTISVYSVPICCSEPMLTSFLKLQKPHGIISLMTHTDCFSSVFLLSPSKKDRLV